MSGVLVSALGSLFPQTRNVFGALSVSTMLGISVPGLLGIATSFVVYRRAGGSSRPYRYAEIFESICLYGIVVATAFATNATWPVIWVFGPFCMIFLATTKPFDRRLPAVIVLLTHGALVLAHILRGDAYRAWIALGMGALSWLTFDLLSKHGLKDIDLEAQRNLARARLGEAMLDGARRRVLQALREGIGAELEAIASAVENGALAPGSGHAVSVVEQTRGLASTLGGMLEAAPTKNWHLSELRRRIDDKCRPLAGDAYSSRLLVDRDPILAADRSGPLLRVAQELVRNAVVHGAARSVRVELELSEDTLYLRVEDDGSGLTRERFETATGGLENAAAWLREVDGALDLVSLPEPRRGAALCATVHVKFVEVA